MKRNSKLSLALHALGHMAQAPDVPRTSEDLAQLHATHPVVVRRVLAPLRNAGLLQSEKGHHGGWRLARPAADITIAAIYAALDEPFLSPGRFSPDPAHPCAIEAAMAETVAAAMVEAEAVISRHFAQKTLADIARAVGAGAFSAFPQGDSPL